MTQLTLTGEILKQQGLESVEANNQTFVETMRRIAIGRSIMYGQVTSDDLRLVAAAASLKPKRPNCWGAVLKGPEWQVIGRRPSDIPGNHGREIKVFQWVGK